MLQCTVEVVYFACMLNFECFSTTNSQRSLLIITHKLCQVHYISLGYGPLTVLACRKLLTLVQIIVQWSYFVVITLFSLIMIHEFISHCKDIPYGIWEMLLDNFIPLRPQESCGGYSVFKCNTMLAHSHPQSSKVTWSLLPTATWQNIVSFPYYWLQEACSSFSKSG